jgi:type VI secretion system secreted protein VgrG
MTDTQSQKNLFLTVKTTAGEDMFILHKMEGTEEISELFEFQAELYSMTAKNANALSMDFSTLLQKDATISITLDNKFRYFQGIITNIMQGPTVRYALDTNDKTHEKTYFRITIRPKMWLLTLRENCRIFQTKTTMEIIKAVLSEHQITIDDQTTNAGTEKRDFCVQYNESDFAFISRLMEAEGIYYFFTHTDSTHTLVLFDGGKPYATCDNAPQIKVLDPLVPQLVGIETLNVHQQVISDTFTTKDYDFETPKVDLKAQAKGTTSTKEVYNYPGNYTVQATGETISTCRLDAIDFKESLISGTMNIPYIGPGYSFKLLNALRTDLNNIDYVFLKITHYASYHEEDANEKVSLNPMDHINSREPKISYSNTFSCFPKSIKYRSPLKTTRPRIYGTQTATVTGKDQEEIWTDKYGRVLVKFPWDLSDTKNEETSCWIRVMQHWTGQNWGMQFTPRIGQEVVVTFLNGDPDYPLITGCVYNGDNLPPYLPAEPTKSTIKTNSSKQASGGDPAYNELRFEDKTDSEEVYMRAQKDLAIDVVDGNRTTTLQAKKSTAVTDTLKIVKGDRIKTLTEGNETVTLSKGNRSITLTEGNDSLTLSKGDQTIDITGAQTQKVSKNCTVTIGGDLTIEVTGNISMKGKAFKIQCSTFEVDAQTSVTIKAGTAAAISAGTTMTVKGEAQATFQSSAMVSVKGGMVSVEGEEMATLKGSAMAQVTGGMIQIG